MLVTNVPVNGQPREVVYVATEGNTVYAIDPEKGLILNHRNLGAPVVGGDLGFCTPSCNIGIMGTPTIDIASATMYLLAYTKVAGVATYHLHALDLVTLSDKPGSPVTVAATHNLADGSVVHFDAKVQLQRRLSYCRREPYMRPSEAWATFFRVRRAVGCWDGMLQHSRR